jgi:molybdate transport system permease protein
MDRLASSHSGWAWGQLTFSFPGLVIASCIYSLPFVVQPLQNAFEAIGDRPLEAALTLRASPWDRFWCVAVPLAQTRFPDGGDSGLCAYGG